MKKLYFYFIILVVLLSCERRDKPDCTSLLEGVRIIYLNEAGDNLLGGGSLNITNIYFEESGDSLQYELIGFVIPGSPEKFHLNLGVIQLYDSCHDQDCNILFEFDGITKLDTLNLEIYTKFSGSCETDLTRTFTYNGVDYLNQTENTIGAYEILR